MWHRHFQALHSAFRRQPELALLAVLPVLLLALNPNWIYGRLYHDPWIYFGHMQNFTGHMRAFGDLYAASRLTIILPGAILYKILPAEAANGVLHLGLYYVALGSLYYVLAQALGRRPATIMAVVCGCHFFFLEAIGWDYIDGFIIAYFLASLACLTRAAVAPAWRAWLTLAGLLAAAVVITNISAVLLMPVLVLHFVVCNRARQRAPLDAGGFWFALGGLGLFAALALVSYRANGRWWFLGTQFQFAASVLSNSEDRYHAPLKNWIGGAYWLVFPTLALGSSALRLGKALMHRERPPWHRWSIALAWHGAFWLLAIVLLYLQLRTRSFFLQTWFYVNFLLLPIAFLVLAEVWSDALASLQPRNYVIILIVMALSLVVSQGLPWMAENPGAWGRIGKAASIGLVAVAAMAPSLAPRRAALALTGLVAIVGLNGLCRHEFLTKTGFPPLHHGPIMMDASQALDPLRPQAFRAIYDCAQLARKIDQTANVWFWFDMNERLGPVYNIVTCTHWWYARMINRGFPALQPEAGLTADALVLPFNPGHPAYQPGRKIIILSEDPAAMDKAVASLQAHSVNVRPVDAHAVGKGRVAFTASVLEILPPSRAERTGDARIAFRE